MKKKITRLENLFKQFIELLSNALLLWTSLLSKSVCMYIFQDMFLSSFFLLSVIIITFGLLWPAVCSCFGNQIIFLNVGIQYNYYQTEQIQWNYYQMTLDQWRNFVLEGGLRVQTTPKSWDIKFFYCIFSVYNVYFQIFLAILYVFP